MDYKIIFYFCLNSMLMTIILIGLIISAIMPGIEKLSRKFFVSLFTNLFFLMTVTFIITFVFQNPEMLIENKIAVFLQYFLISLPLPMFTAYFLKSCGESLRKNLIFRAVIASWIIYFILLAVGQFTGIFYYFDAEKVGDIFCRGELHAILFLPLILIIFLNLYCVMRLRKNLPKKYFVAFLIFLIPLATTFSIYAFFYFEIMLFFGVVISTLSMFGIILYDQTEKYFEQQREISKQRANILILQMRPHFIYNAMMSIYYLCAKNPKKAQEIILDFTTYLRKNFTAIVSEEKILFSEELEHVRAYLAIEQVQFEENLMVEYEILQKNFKIPPLTLQPIVENSIKHAMDPENAPLLIKIFTCETEFGNEILVEDNGEGFDAEKIFEKSLTLSNIKNRLKIMCGGELEIKSDAGGTIVKIFVPFED